MGLFYEIGFYNFHYNDLLNDNISYSIVVIVDYLIWYPIIIFLCYVVGYVVLIWKTKLVMSFKIFTTSGFKRVEISPKSFFSTHMLFFLKFFYNFSTSSFLEVLEQFEFSLVLLLDQ